MFNYFLNLLLLLSSYFTPVVALLVLYLTVRWLTSRPPNFPPGPWTVPLVGTVSLLGKNPEKIFPALRKKYGDVFSVYVGPKPLVVIGGVDRIREVLLKHGHASSGRPDLLVTDAVFHGKGLLFTQGQAWKEQRTFTVSKLRALGMGKVSLEKRVLEEVASFVKYLNGFGGQPVELLQHLYTSVTNVILSVVAGRRYQYDDPDLVRFLKAVTENAQLLVPCSILNVFPWLFYLPGDVFNIKAMMRNQNTCVTFFKKLVADHRLDLDSENCRDFIDAYLTQIEACKDNLDTTFTDMQLLYLASELVSAGYDTTSTTMSWGILYLTLYPGVQTRVQAELDEVLGSGRYVSVTDKPKLPYTEATTMEIQRIANLALFLPPHCTTEDLQVGGCVIPRDTILLLMTGDTQSDPDQWENPGVFNPERFLVDGKVVRPEKFFPFSVGRRSCPGEALAKMQLFLFFATLMQNFTFKFPPDTPTPSTERILGFTTKPHPYKVCAVPRNNPRP